MKKGGDRRERWTRASPIPCNTKLLQRSLQRSYLQGLYLTLTLDLNPKPSDLITGIDNVLTFFLSPPTNMHAIGDLV